jgi:hypothetical protein
VVGRLASELHPAVAPLGARVGLERRVRWLAVVVVRWLASELHATLASELLAELVRWLALVFAELVRWLALVLAELVRRLALVRFVRRLALVRLVWRLALVRLVVVRLVAFERRRWRRPPALAPTGSTRPSGVRRRTSTPRRS